MTTKGFTENGYRVVLDTNVLLNIYRYSPEFSEFALECLKAVKNHIILPATVRLEYEKHERGEFSKMERRTEEASKETAKQIETAKLKIINSCHSLERLQYQDVDDLKINLSEKIDAVKSVLDNYFEDHAALGLIQHSWAGNDFLERFVEEIDTNGQVMISPSQEDIYRWCEEGEKRYKNEIPPGFKDAKNKDGVRKYSDLILWQETLRYAKKESTNLLFITDDVKADWWEFIDGDRQFHSKLIARLRAVTQKINSAFDFLPMGDSRAYISPMNTASVFFSPGEGILNFLYADFDSAYSECLNRTKKDLPDETSLDISLLTEKEKKLYYYLALTETQKRFKPLIEASMFTAEFPPILLHCSEQELTDYYHYLKEMQNNLVNLIEATFDENFCDGFFNRLTHKTRFAGYCRKHGLPTEQKRTIVHIISIVDSEHQVENVLEGYIESDFDLDIKMAAASEVSPSVQNNLDKLGFTMPEMISLSAMQADEYETCICESIEQQIEFELIQLLKSDIGMRKCKRCGKYFIMKGNYDTNYCDRISEGETRNCQDLAAQENYKKKMADNAAIPLYQKYYKRYAARVRVRQIKEPDFKKWKYQAMTKRDECSDGKITLAGFEEWLEASFPNRKKKQ